nr:hypothetical protein [Herbaspirillum sp. RV1423]
MAICIAGEPTSAAMVDDRRQPGARPRHRTICRPLQMVIEGSADYNAASGDKMHNKKVEQFDFNQVVQQLEQARQAAPALNSGALRTPC